MKPHVLLFGCVMATAAVAQEDYFAFMPDGGRVLTQRLIAADPLAAGALANARPATDWLAQIAADNPPGAAKLDEWQRQTLADYLAYAGALTDPALLPQDGRDITLAHCQSCHIVTVVVTQARKREAWLATMIRPSHVEIPISEAERSQLADYLVVNAGLPIEAIPVELRAGGASY